MKLSIKNLLVFVSMSFLALQLSGCSKNVKPGDYDASEVGKVNKVVPGVIVSARPVNIHNKTQADGSPMSIDENTSMMRSHGFEYVIKLNSGAIISLVQADDTQFKSKQHVLVMYGVNTRVVADDGSADY